MLLIGSSMIQSDFQLLAQDIALSFIALLIIVHAAYFWFRPLIDGEWQEAKHLYLVAVLWITVQLSFYVPTSAQSLILLMITAVMLLVDFRKEVRVSMPVWYGRIRVFNSAYLMAMLVIVGLASL
jgi:hypothetical protein